MQPGGQISSLRNGVDIVIACPGRLEDHVRSGHADLGAVEVTVLDEADHMADLGFLPGVRRLLDTTPRRGQRMLFSATLDAGVDVLVKRYLTDPVTHSVDSAQSPVARHDPPRAARRQGRADPGAGRPDRRTRSHDRVHAHQARREERGPPAQPQGVPAIELHGNLSQNARTRNLAAFSTGTATTLVATDIAARGIHVDDVGLVVHADPPVEHKAYLHRSGRTARAGNEGTVVTLMLDSQVSDVRDLARKAGIKPTITRLGTGHPLLEQIAPGERTFVAASAMPERAADDEAASAVAATAAGRATPAGVVAVVVARAMARPRRRPPAATATAVAVAAPAPRPRRHPVAVRTAPRRSPPTGGAADSRVVPAIRHLPARESGASCAGTIRARYLSSVDDRPRIRRAMISCWICWVPSKMSRILESRAHFSSRSCSE